MQTANPSYIENLHIKDWMKINWYIMFEVVGLSHFYFSKFCDVILLREGENLS